MGALLHLLTRSDSELVPRVETVGLGPFGTACRGSPGGQRSRGHRDGAIDATRRGLADGVPAPCPAAATVAPSRPLLAQNSAEQVSRSARAWLAGQAEGSPGLIIMIDSHTGARGSPAAARAPRRRILGVRPPSAGAWRAPGLDGRPRRPSRGPLASRWFQGRAGRRRRDGAARWADPAGAWRGRGGGLEGGRRRDACRALQVSA